MARTTPGAAAAHNSVRTFNSANLTPGRPSSTNAVGNRASNYVAGNHTLTNPSNTRTTRTWEAQGTQTDRGHAPQGFGSDARPNNSTQSARVNRNDRPPWAGSGTNGAANTRSYEPQARSYSNNGRSYEPSTRSYSAPRSTYPSSRPSYSAPQRSYTAPSRTYSAPSHNYSAPSHSSGGSSSHGGGGSSHGGGGGSHGGGGGSHGGGGHH